ncbi:MAG: hypothetical protein HYW34_02720, partial [Candidatus Brennerbacteria bacterium]|nr:hypothetical protein [Candidatus Brennerbacteria bacterium]
MTIIIPGKMRSWAQLSVQLPQEQLQESASGIPASVRDNNANTAYGVSGSCANGSCSLGMTVQVNIPSQNIQALYVDFSFNQGNTSGQIYTNTEVLSNGVWVKAGSEGGATTFSNSNKTINSNTIGGATPWPKVTAIKITISETATYSGG